MYERLEELWSHQKHLRKCILLQEDRWKLQDDASHVAAQSNSTPLNFSLDIKQEPSRDSNNDISLERIVETKGDEIAYKQEELDLYSRVAPIYDEYPEPYNEESSEEVVEAPFVDMIDDLKGDIEAPCVETVEDLKGDVETPCVEIVESLKDLEEVFETIGMENVGSKIECLEVIDSHSRYEIGLQVVQTRKHEFVKVDFVPEKSPLADYVHVERFVELNPTKLRGRIFTQKGKVQQVSWSCGNTSNLINLVSLFNIWVGIIMQVRARNVILTCRWTLGFIVSNLL